MDPLAAIRTATLNGAELLGVDDRGAIAPGRLADLIAVRGNPLEDVRVLQDVRFVMLGGKVVSRR
jgi:imidazolonepropionase-like amidohydrolase